MSISIVQMAPTAKIIVEQVLAIKPGEKVCVFTDTQCPESITHLLAATTQAAGAEPVIVAIIPREVGGVDPPPSAIAAIQAADVIISQSSYSIVHTETLREALRRGARACEMWGFNEDMMVHGGATADYKEVQELTQRIEQMLSSGNEVRITTEAGTDLALSVKGRHGHVLAASATEPGTFCAFPDGEAAIAPLEGTTTGIFKDPFCIEKEGMGIIKESLAIKIDKGMVQDIEGGAVAKQIIELLEKVGENAGNIAELGIATNPKCRLGTTIRETKKSWGTTHIALGDSKSLGGEVSCSLHMDMVLTGPTLTIDGQAVLKDGKVVI